MGRAQNKFMLMFIVMINLVFIVYVWIHEFENQKRIFKEYYLYSIENIIKNGSTNEAIAEKLDSELIDFSKDIYYFKDKNVYEFINGNQNKIQYERDEIELSSLNNFVADCFSRNNCLRIFIKSNEREAWKIEINSYLDLTYKSLIQLQVIGFLSINFILFLISIVVYKLAKSRPLPGQPPGEG